MKVGDHRPPPATDWFCAVVGEDGSAGQPAAAILPRCCRCRHRPRCCHRAADASGGTGDAGKLALARHVRQRGRPQTNATITRDDGANPIRPPLALMGRPKTAPDSEENHGGNAHKSNDRVLVSAHQLVQ